MGPLLVAAVEPLRRAVIEPETWELHHAGKVVAQLEVVSVDYPWVSARVRRLPGFEAVAELFREEIELFYQLEGRETGEWITAHDRIRECVTLTYPDHEVVPEFLMHLDEAREEARWRWAEKTFVVPESADAPGESHRCG